MTPKKAIPVALAAIAVISLLLWSHARGYHQGTAPASSASSAPGPRLIWKTKCDFNVSGSIALGADGTIYAGGNNGMCAFSSDGKLKWKRPLAGFLYLAGGSDGNIYVSSSYGFAFGVSNDGSLNWDPRYGLIGFGGPPAVGADGTVIYANTVSDLYAFRPGRSDRDIWSQSTFREGVVSSNASLPGSARVGTTQSRNSPVIWRDETIALPRQHWLHLFNPDGSPAWFIELTSEDLGPAALADDGTIYVPDDRYSLFAVDHSGNKKWEYQMGVSILGSVVVGQDGTIFFATRDSVYALAPDGTLKWQIRPPQGCTTSPVLAQDGTIYVGGNSGAFALHPDGSVKWTTTSISGVATIAPDGTMYGVCAYSEVCAVRDEGSPLAKSPWPKMYHDPANTSRILTPF